MMSEHNDHNDDSWRSRAWSQLAVKTRQQEMFSYSPRSAEHGSFFNLSYPSTFNRNDFAQKKVFRLDKATWPQLAVSSSWKAEHNACGNRSLMSHRVFISSWATLSSQRSLRKEDDHKTWLATRFPMRKSAAANVALKGKAYRLVDDDDYATARHWNIFSRFIFFLLDSREAPGMNYSRSWWLLTFAIARN